MLQCRLPVRDGTVNVYKTVAGVSGQEGDTHRSGRKLKLSDDEEEIAKEARKADQPASGGRIGRGLPRGLMQIQTDMRIVSGRLR